MHGSTSRRKCVLRRPHHFQSALACSRLRYKLLHPTSRITLVAHVYIARSEQVLLLGTGDGAAEVLGGPRTVIHANISRAVVGHLQVSNSLSAISGGLLAQWMQTQVLLTKKSRNLQPSAASRTSFMSSQMPSNGTRSYTLCTKAQRHQPAQRRPVRDIGQAA